MKKHLILGLVFVGSVGVTLFARTYGDIHSLAEYPILAALFAVLGIIIRKNTRGWFRRRFPRTWRLYAVSKLGPVFVVILLVHASICWASTDGSVLIPALSYVALLQVVLYAAYTLIPIRSMVVLIVLSPIAAIAAVFVGLYGAMIASGRHDAGYLLVFSYPPVNYLYAPILSLFLAVLFGRARHSADKAL